MITTSMLGPLTIDRNREIDKLNLYLPKERRRSMDGTGIVVGAILGSILVGIMVLFVLAAVRWLS